MFLNFSRGSLQLCRVLQDQFFHSSLFIYSSVQSTVFLEQLTGILSEGLCNFHALFLGCSYVGSLNQLESMFRVTTTEQAGLEEGCC